MELYEDLAIHALDLFPVRVQRLHPLRQSDNLTWQIMDKDNHAYLLRLHHSISAVMAGSRQNPDSIRSELEWLGAISQTGLPVQHPLRSLSRDYVALLPLGSRMIPCTLLTWLEGKHYDANEHGIPAVAASFGRLAAFLHNQSLAWTPPPGFSRPTYDVAHFQRLIATLSRGVQMNIISYEDWAVIRRAADQLLGDVLISQGISDQWGLIHADLHSGNILIRGEDVLVIDFSLCGFGSFLFDLSIALVAGVPAELRRFYLQAYRHQRALPDEYLPLIEAYGLAGVLSYCAYQIDNPEQMEWLTYRIPRLAASECRKYLNREPIYFEE